MALLDRFVEAAENLRVTNIVVLRNGDRVAEHHWDGEIRRNQYSASKSVTAVAVGIAVKEGLLSLEERVADCFPAELPGNPCPQLLELRVRDLLTMQIGHHKAYLMAEDRQQIQDPNWVRYALAQPFFYRPGEKFIYNNVGPYLAGVLVQRRAGCDLISYLMPRLFQPLGIRRPWWETDPDGQTFGAGGLMLTVSELALFSQLLLQEGRWNGKEIVTREWLAEAASPHAPTGHTNPHSRHYGYGFWLGRDGTFRADGKYGQYGIVSREKNAVIAVNAESREADSILDCLWDTLFPQL